MYKDLVGKTAETLCRQHAEGATGSLVICRRGITKEKRIVGTLPLAGEAAGLQVYPGKLKAGVSYGPPSGLTRCPENALPPPLAER